MSRAVPNELRVVPSRHADIFFWYCTHCVAEHDFGSGYAATISDAGDQARGHVNRCPTIRRGLNRLMAAVLEVE